MIGEPSYDDGSVRGCAGIRLNYSDEKSSNSYKLSLRVQRRRIELCSVPAVCQQKIALCVMSDFFNVSVPSEPIESPEGILEDIPDADNWLILG